MAAKESIQLPVLDVSEPGPGTAEELIEAVKKYGFVFIKNNHSEIPVKDIDNMFSLVSSPSYFYGRGNFGVRRLAIRFQVKIETFKFLSILIFVLLENVALFG